MHVLIIDDEKSICEAFARLLEQEGFSTATPNDPEEGRALAVEAGMILLDLKLPGVEGLSFLKELSREYPRTPIVMVTAHGTVETAVEAMKQGASDFIVKPAEKDQLVDAVHKALRKAQAEEKVSELYYELPDEVVFRDPRSQELLDEVRRVAGTDLALLLHGETGVGKEIFARLAHEWSGRAKSPLVKINCAAIPEALFESEFFGYEKGAFSGATTSKPGRVELAEGGTLFLDEVGELPTAAQAKLLQFLQDGTFERVGGLRTRRADVRIISATNRDPTDRDSFRQDLYFRLAGVMVEIPPLRERREDIVALAEHFLARFGARYGKQVVFAPDAMAALRAHDWPGNVRELEHALEKAIALSTGAEITAAQVVQAAVSPAAGGTLREQKAAFERVRVADALKQTGGNRTEAARVLGISRRMLQKK
ncbi:MAG: sigma-54 dependent transcriptional regulator, partial [Planctomycetota bacterium]|nr:sigma-54 dependent transcriptional regulator [Planctomycetota bacterium]